MERRLLAAVLRGLHGGSFQVGGEERWVGAGLSMGWREGDLAARGKGAQGSLLFGSLQELAFWFAFPGREKELALFESHLNAYVARKESHILAFEGAIGSGKSHLLSELACLGQAAGHR